MPDAVSLLAPAKVNLRLCVLAREASGYHSLESLFCAVSLFDRVEVRRGAPGIRLVVEGGVDTGPAESNLALRAGQGFYEWLGRGPELEIRLEKRIPAAAGLGGGSSDAAATLRALNVLEGEPLTPAELLEVGMTLGADVPFFLCGSPLALGWGRGERLLRLPALPPRPVLVAHPGAAVPTGEAFAALSEARLGASRHTAVAFSLEEVCSWEGMEALQQNHFEEVVLPRIPLLRQALYSLRAEGAGIVLVAGSGGCVFGVFDEAGGRERSQAELERLGLTCWSCETLESLPAPQVDLAADDR